MKYNLCQILKYNVIKLTGNCVFNWGEHCDVPFSGQLTKVNMFAKELTPSEVREIWASSTDTDVENKQDLKIQISWNDLLKENRNGSIVESVEEVQVKEAATGYY